MDRNHQSQNYNLNGAAQTVQSNALQNQQVDMSSMDVIGNRLREVRNFVDHQGERLEQIDAKLNGGQSAKSDSTGQAPRPIPNGTVAEMDDILNDIMIRLQCTDGVVSRLRVTI